MDEQKPEIKQREVPRERLPWNEITDAERVQRLREIIKRDQMGAGVLRREIGELREIFMRHQHGANNAVLVSAERQSHYGQTEVASGCKLGQEWF